MRLHSEHLLLLVVNRDVLLWIHSSPRYQVVALPLLVTLLKGALLCTAMVIATLSLLEAFMMVLVIGLGVLQYTQTKVTVQAIDRKVDCFHHKHLNKRIQCMEQSCHWASM